MIVSVRLSTHFPSAMTPPDPNSPAPRPDATWAFDVGELVADRYRITEHLAQGAFGEVHAARETDHDHRVALKILQTDSLERDPKAVARMRQEAEILRALEHPNLVQVHDTGSTDGHEFLVMELLEGRSLRHLLDDEQLASPQTARPVAVQILSALEAMHERGVQHRDIKPDNIILLDRDDESPTIKLVDFGIAKARDFLDSDHEHTLVETKADEFVGTPRYASPEQALGDPVGPGGDLFSLGLVLAEWMTGTPRIDRSDQRGAVSLLIQPDPIDVSDCPPDWQSWLQEMLAKTPEERFSSASDALAALPGDDDPVERMTTQRTRLGPDQQPEPQVSISPAAEADGAGEAGPVERVGSPGDPLEPTEVRSEPPTPDELPSPAGPDSTTDVHDRANEIFESTSERRSDLRRDFAEEPTGDEEFELSTLLWTLASVVFFAASLTLFLYTLLSG